MTYFQGSFTNKRLTATELPVCLCICIHGALLALPCHVLVHFLGNHGIWLKTGTIDSLKESTFQTY
jgi:hypothetical protein